MLSQIKNQKLQKTLLHDKNRVKRCLNSIFFRYLYCFFVLSGSNRATEGDLE